MSFFITRIPAAGCQHSQGELNQFVNTHRILSVDKRFVDLGDQSYWAFVVDYLETKPSLTVSQGPGPHRGKGKVDYREVLDPSEFSLFAALRELRKQFATEEGTPVYTIFTNEQLAQIVQKKVADKTGLSKIDGIGQSRIDKFSDRILKLVAEHGSIEHEAKG